MFATLSAAAESGTEHGTDAGWWPVPVRTGLWIARHGRRADQQDATCCGRSHVLWRARGRLPVWRQPIQGQNTVPTPSTADNNNNNKILRLTVFRKKKKKCFFQSPPQARDKNCTIA